MAADFSIQGALIKKSHYSSSRNFLDLTLTTSSLKNIFDYIDDPIENYGSIAHVKSFFLGEWSRIFSGDCRELYKMFFTKSDIESLEGWEDLDEKIDFFFEYADDNEEAKYHGNWSIKKISDREITVRWVGVPSWVDARYLSPLGLDEQSMYDILFLSAFDELRPAS